MKKNKPMRAAGLLLIATMLTTCMTAGTFAKYTTGDSASDTARVAKFGVVVKAQGDLYGKTYYANDQITPDNPAYGETNAINLSVASSNEDKVVAPGTTNTTGLAFSITGTPEVAVKVSTAFANDNASIYLKTGTYGVMIDTSDDINADNFAAKKADLYTLADGSYTKLGNDATYSATTAYFKLSGEVTLANDYYPVVYTLKKQNQAVTLSIADLYTVDTLALLQEKVSGYIDNKDYLPNTNLDDGAINEYQVTWAWDFERGTDDAVKALYNKADTILGDLAAGNFGGTVVEADGAAFKAINADKYNLNTKFDMSITVDQVD